METEKSVVSCCPGKLVQDCDPNCPDALGAGVRPGTDGGDLDIKECRQASSEAELLFSQN